jgi:hypothetical protein
MTTHQPSRHLHLAGAALTAIAIATPLAPPPPTAHAAPPNAPTVCSLTPEPDAMPVQPGILTTVIIRNGELAVLHRLDCDGRTVAWRWITPNDLLTPSDRSACGP